ncbi:hypothetical protein [Vulcanisaeta sp. JCM 16161]
MKSIRKKDEDVIRLLEKASKELRKIREIYGEDFVVRSIREDRDSR